MGGIHPGILGGGRTVLHKLRHAESENQSDDCEEDHWVLNQA